MDTHLTYPNFYEIHILYYSITLYFWKMDRISCKMKFKIIVLQPNLPVSLLVHF